MRDEIEVPQRLHRGHAAVRDFPVVNYGLRSHYWFPHVPLALLLAVAAYWMLRASLGTHWPEYLKMLAEGTFRLELKTAAAAADWHRHDHNGAWIIVALPPGVGYGGIIGGDAAVWRAGDAGVCDAARLSAGQPTAAKPVDEKPS